MATKNTKSTKRGEDRRGAAGRRPGVGQTASATVLGIDSARCRADDVARWAQRLSQSLAGLDSGREVDLGVVDGQVPEALPVARRQVTGVQSQLGDLIGVPAHLLE